MKGLQSISAKGMEELRHDGQMTTDCRSAAQFITDCQWWKTESPVKAHFLTGFGPDYDNEGNRCPFSEEGPLHINVISAWPKSAEVMIGTQPEPIHVQKQVEYVIKGDGQVLKEGKSGVWILGEQEIDVSVKNVRRLSLSVKVGESSRNTLFWANGVVITSDGKRISLKDLPQKNRNVLPIGQPGKDYYGGEVKIAGMTVKNAIEAEPIIADEESTIEFDLSQINAERLQVLWGGDFPWVMRTHAARRWLYVVMEQTPDS